MKQVERGHWSNEAKEYYYAKRAAALGVRNREDSLKQNSTDVSNDTTVSITRRPRRCSWGQSPHNRKMGEGPIKEIACLTQN